MKHLLLALLALLVSCTDFDTEALKPTPGGSDSTDDIHCWVAWTEIPGTGVCYRAGTWTCPSPGWTRYLATNNTGIPGPAATACHCATGSAQFGVCQPVPNGPTNPDYTNCPLHWLSMASTTNTRGICGIVPADWWRGVGGVVKSFKSRLTDPIRVYISSDDVAVVDTIADHLTVLVDGSFGCSGWTGKTWDGGCVFLDEVHPEIPAPNTTDTSLFLFSWEDFP